MSSKEKVFIAAESIAARGEIVTQNAIREELGGGSFSTISPLLKEWRAQAAQAARPRRDAEEAIPEGVEKVVAELMRRTWAEAKNVASIGLEAARRDVEEARSQAAAELAEGAEIVVLLEAERDKAQAAAEAAIKERDAAIEHASAERDLRVIAEAETGRLRERVQGAERHAEDSRDAAERAYLMKTEADTRAAQIAAERDAARAEADQARKDGAAAVADERRISSEAVKTLEATAADLRESVASLREQVAALNAEKAVLSDQIKSTPRAGKAATKTNP